MTSIDDCRVKYPSIGFGMINNVGYVIINIYWITLEFQVAFKIFKIRMKYGSNDWSDWVSLY